MMLNQLWSAFSSEFSVEEWRTKRRLCSKSNGLTFHQLLSFSSIKYWSHSHSTWSVKKKEKKLEIIDCNILGQIIGRSSKDHMTYWLNSGRIWLKKLGHLKLFFKGTKSNFQCSALSLKRRSDYNENYFAAEINIHNDIDIWHDNWFSKDQE